MIRFVLVTTLKYNPATKWQHTIWLDPLEKEIGIQKTKRNTLGCKWNGFC